MGGFGHSYKTLEEKVRFHRKRAQYYLDCAAEWEPIVSEIQQLQRSEQASAEVQLLKVPPRPLIALFPYSSRIASLHFCRTLLAISLCGNLRARWHAVCAGGITRLFRRGRTSIVLLRMGADQARSVVKRRCREVA
jgi:hypothetical protein